MANYQDYKDTMGGTQQAWIHELAKAEIHPDAERILDLGRSQDPHRLVEESTVEFLTSLRDRFNDYARIFNAYSESGARYSDVKVYTLAQSAADFMVFRNQVKLIVSNTVHGVIQFTFTRHLRTPVTVDGGAPGGVSETSSPAQELHAQVSPFREVSWTYQGEKVRPEELARFYFTEFVRSTRIAQRSGMSGKLLLEEIKTLLKEKGLDL